MSFASDVSIDSGTNLAKTSRITRALTLASFLITDLILFVDVISAG